MKANLKSALRLAERCICRLPDFWFIHPFQLNEKKKLSKELGSRFRTPQVHSHVTQRSLEPSNSTSPRIFLFAPFSESPWSLQNQAGKVVYLESWFCNMGLLDDGWRVCHFFFFLISGKFWTFSQTPMHKWNFAVIEDGKCFLPKKSPQETENNDFSTFFFA